MLQCRLVKAHVVCDHIGRQGVWVNKLGVEGTWVAELVTAGLYWQRHRQVVELPKAEQQVLHGGAGCFVGLEKDNIGVLRFVAWRGIQSDRTIHMEALFIPKGTEKKKTALDLSKSLSRLGSCQKKMSCF